MFEHAGTSQAVIFAGDFNEDDSGPVVRSLASKRDKDDKDRRNA